MILALFFVGTLHAGVPKTNVPIAACTDGNVYSVQVDGDCDPPPPYEALDFDIADALATAGIEAMECGTTGSDFSHDVRQYLSGTNAATAVISIVEATGSDPEDSGFTAPGSGDNLVFECANDVDASGSFRLSATDGTSTDQSAVKPWAAFGTEDPEPPTDRNLLIESDYESGDFNTPSFISNGVYKDVGNVHTISPRATFTISDITNHATAPVMTWSGADPPFINPDSETNGGFTIGTVSAGMTGAAGKLYRCASINTGANTCALRQDGTGVANTSDGNQALGDNNVNTSGLGTWSGTATATLWEREEFQSGGLDASATTDVKIVQSITPPENLVGTAQAFSPLLGNFFLSAMIDRDKDYSSFPGNGQKNKPRFISFYPSGSEIDYNEEFCVSVGIGLPSNYDHNDIAGEDATSNQILTFPDSAAADVPAWMITLRGNASGEDHWNLTLRQGSPLVNVDLGSVATSVNMYTIWTLRGKMHATNGFIRVYRAYADRNGNNPTADALVYSRGPGVAVGFDPAGVGFRLNLRGYKYGWNHNAGTTPSRKIWWAIDELRATRIVADSATCVDAHPFGADLE